MQSVHGPQHELPIIKVDLATAAASPGLSGALSLGFSGDQQPPDVK